MKSYLIDDQINFTICLLSENGIYCNESMAEYILNKYKECNNQQLDFNLADKEILVEIKPYIE